MSRVILVALLPVVCLTGCLDEPRSRVLASGAPSPASLTRSNRFVHRAPATEATAKRVLAVGQKIILGNPQLGLRPTFITVGAPHAEIFHRGGGIDSHEVIISEGLVKRCKNDEEIAALLCLELGKIVSERESLAGPMSRQADNRLPPHEVLDRDSTGPLGSPDGTRRMELANLEQQRRDSAKPAPPPAPETLARGYMTKAGYGPEHLTAVAPLVRLAEQHQEVEKHLGAIQTN